MLHTRTSGKTNVLVQVGQCSRAVGAGAVADALALAMEDRTDAYLTIAGCDGSCFAGPQVIVTGPSGQSRRYQHLSTADVPALARTLDIWSVQPREAKSSPNLPDDLSDFFAPQTRLLLDRCGKAGPESADEYLEAGGYSGLDRALSLPPEDVIQTVLDAGLLGRGGGILPRRPQVEGRQEREGGLIPTWWSTRKRANLAYSRTGTFWRGTRHLLLEGMLIAAYATGTGSGYIYINAEANLSAERLEAAIADARSSGLIGKDILGSGFDFQVTVRRGGGRLRLRRRDDTTGHDSGKPPGTPVAPPFPTESGLFQQPTVINNVETLSNVPLILRVSDGEGDGEASHSFSSLGLENARGTKLVCLSGVVMRPGMAEVPMGTTIRDVVYKIGGGRRRAGALAWSRSAAPSSGIIPVTELDLPLQPGMLHSSGVVMGAGGIMVLDDTVPVIDVVRRLAAYNAAESCGKCTPCREGTPRMVAALDRLNSNAGTAADIEELKSLGEIVGSASLCGLGQMAGGPFNSALHFFAHEFAALGRVQ